MDNKKDNSITISKSILDYLSKRDSAGIDYSNIEFDEIYGVTKDECDALGLQLREKDMWFMEDS